MRMSGDQGIRGSGDQRIRISGYQEIRETRKVGNEAGKTKN